MILLLLLCILIGTVVAGVLFAGATLTAIFGDIIVFVVVIVWSVESLRKRKKKDEEKD